MSDSDDRPFAPRLVYDDDCGFCTWCARFAAARGEFDLVGFSALSPDQLARLPDEYEECSHLLTQEHVYSCGEGVEEALLRIEGPLRMLAIGFRSLPNHERLRERLYRWGADNRALWGKLVRCEPPARESA